MALRLAAVFFLSYLLGNLNGSILISRFFAHDDVRTHGSGNAGFTNFFRYYGKRSALLVFAIDTLKAVFACLAGRLLLAPLGLALEGTALAAAAVSLGHDFPALLGLRGGKGIVCGFASAVMLDWRVAVICLLLFTGTYLATKLVSLSSLLCAVTLAVGFTARHSDRPWAVACCIFMCALAVFMHRENILRLCKGTERKTDFFKKENRP